MVRSLTITLTVLFLSLCSYAQSGNAFLGYSYLNASSSGDRANINGWNGSLEGKVFPFVGIVADVSGYYGQQPIQPNCTGLPDCFPFSVGTHQHIFTFGPRVSVPVGKFTPFAHALFGAAHISAGGLGSDTSFAETIGGGVDYKLVHLINWRIQGDFVQTHFFSARQNNLRLSTGIVLRF